MFQEPCSETKGIALVVGGETVAGIENQPRGGAVGREQHIRHDRLGHQVGPLGAQVGVGEFAAIAVGIAVKAAGLHISEIVRRQVVAQPVAFIDGDKQVAGARIEGDADGIADAAGIFHQIALGIDFEHFGAGLIFRDIVMAAHLHKDSAIRRDREIAGGVHAGIAQVGRDGDPFAACPPRSGLGCRARATPPSGR